MGNLVSPRRWVSAQGETWERHGDDRYLCWEENVNPDTHRPAVTWTHARFVEFYTQNSPYIRNYPESPAPQWLLDRYM